jgi:hypothetical protein
MQYNTKANGSPFDENTKLAVWSKGFIIPGFDQKLWRRDKCGAIMCYGDYGNVKSDCGWEIDHIQPKSKKGGDELSNLQPLHWENNRRKGDSDEGSWSCAKK